VPGGAKNVLLYRTVQTVSGAHPAPSGYRLFCPGVKRPGREVGHSFLSSAEVKSEWIPFSAPPPPPCLHGVYIDNFIPDLFKVIKTNIE
jgi:hypothetical protein